jgi:HEAT repeat protein
MSNSENAPHAVSPDDVLPRVEPPNAGFILQLFVVPAVIVVVIVMVWGMFTWLANMGSSPEQYVRQIEQQNANSWFAAHKLAEDLRTDTQLQQNRQIARQLAGQLQTSVKTGATDNDSVQLRAFLCQALGQFRVADGVPALLEAATSGRSEDDLIVRRWALEALAMVASRVSPQDLEPHSELVPMLVQATQDESAQIREAGAYALGVIGGEMALARLERLIDDLQHPGVRFNAATGLARHGRPACIPVLVEMLDLDQLESTSDVLARDLLERLRPEERQPAVDAKRAGTLLNALRASVLLSEANPSADLAPLRRSIDRLLAAELAPHFSQSRFASEVRSEAEAVKKRLGP